MAWVVGTVQSISLEEGLPSRPGFFLGQSASSPALTLDTKTAEECANAMKHILGKGGHPGSRLSPVTSRLLADVARRAAMKMEGAEMDRGIMESRQADRGRAGSSDDPLQ